MAPGGRRADKALWAKLGCKARPRRVSPQEIARKAWDYALKNNATFMDVINAAGLLVEAVAVHSSTPKRQLAEALLREVAKKSADNPKG